MRFWECADRTWVEATREYYALVLAEERGTSLTGKVRNNHPNCKYEVFRWGKIPAEIIACHLQEMYG